MKKYIFLFILGSIMSFSGCGGSEEGPVPFKQVIEDYSIDASGSLQNLEYMVMKGDSAIEEVEGYLDSDAPLERWLAVYVIGRVADAETVTPLLPLLEDEVESVRIAAAGTLANKGYKEALPVLMEGITSEASIDYLHPAVAIAPFCLDVLRVYTGQNFEAAADQPLSEIQEAWNTWWEQEGKNLNWDNATQKYI